MTEAELAEIDFRTAFLAEFPRPEPKPDSLISKRIDLHNRFRPEVAVWHFRRWLEQREAIDREFDRNHPYWQEYKRNKGRP
jgi:hypothetical protein